MMWKIYTVLAITTAYSFSAALTANLPLHIPRHVPKLKIHGGDVVTPNSVPEIAFLKYRSANETKYCTGTIISEYWILTLSTCLKDLQSEVEIVLGAHDVTGDPSTRTILTSKTFMLDGFYLGAIRLPEPVPESDYIRYARLAERGEAKTTYVNQVAKVCGWGDYDDTKKISLFLKCFEETIQPREKCNTPRWAMCIGSDEGPNPNKVCYGDTGGPVFVDGIQVGIVLESLGTCSSNHPSEIVKVGKFQIFIRELLRWTMVE